MKASLAQVRRGINGRMVEVDADVFDLAKRLREIHPALGLDWNETGGYFRVYQHLPDGRKATVTTSTELSPQVIDRVRYLCSSDYDFAGEMDRQDRLAKQAADHRLHEQVGEIGERLAHAIRKDLGTQNRIYLPKGIDRA